MSRREKIDGVVIMFRFRVPFVRGSVAEGKRREGDGQSRGDEKRSERGRRNEKNSGVKRAELILI